jgi:hypothetical protein
VTRGSAGIDAVVSILVVAVGLGVVAWSVNRATEAVAFADSVQMASAELSGQIGGLRAGRLGQTEGWEELAGGLQVRRTLYDPGIWLVEVRAVDRTGRTVAEFSGWELAR